MDEERIQELKEEKAVSEGIEKLSEEEKDAIKALGYNIIVGKRW